MERLLFFKLSSTVGLAVTLALTAPAALAKSPTSATIASVATPTPPAPAGDLIIMGFLALFVALGTS